MKHAAAAKGGSISSKNFSKKNLTNNNMKQQSNKHWRIFLPGAERGGPPPQGNQPTYLPGKTV
jgi:hypothetical protein